MSNRKLFITKIQILFITFLISFETILTVDSYQYMYIYNSYVARKEAVSDYHTVSSFIKKSPTAFSDSSGKPAVLIQTESVVSSSPISSPYNKFIIKMNGLSSTGKHYVAWGHTLVCLDGVITLNYNVKFFDCDKSAIQFYNNDNLVNSISKLRVSNLKEETSDITITVSSKNYSLLNIMGLKGNAGLNTEITKCSS
jgi:hypothetical protein